MRRDGAPAALPRLPPRHRDARVQHGCRVLPEVQEFLSGITVDEARAYAAGLLAAASVAGGDAGLARYSSDTEATSV